jgi:recombinational DNA repair protein (RecF pathway)
MACEHLEVSEFGTYSVKFDGSTQVTTLQKCSNCGKFLTLNGTEVQSKRIFSAESAIRKRMRTVNVLLDSEMYDRLAHLARSETGEDNISKIMNEIVSLGIKHYKQQLTIS